MASCFSVGSSGSHLICFTAKVGAVQMSLSASKVWPLEQVTLTLACCSICVTVCLSSTRCLPTASASLSISLLLPPSIFRSISFFVLLSAYSANAENADTWRMLSPKLLLSSSSLRFRSRPLHPLLIKNRHQSYLSNFCWSSSENCLKSAIICWNLSFHCCE